MLHQPGTRAIKRAVDRFPYFGLHEQRKHLAAEIYARRRKTQAVTQNAQCCVGTARSKLDVRVGAIPREAEEPRQRIFGRRPW